jgi:hypothetical protein
VPLKKLDASRGFLPTKEDVPPAFSFRARQCCIAGPLFLSNSSAIPLWPNVNATKGRLDAHALHLYRTSLERKLIAKVKQR